MSDLITTLHPQGDNSVNLYPNVKLENIIDGTAEDAGKFVKVNEEGKFIVDTVDIPEPQQVNNSTVTIKQGGVDKGSFTLNQAEDATIELDAGGAGESGSNMYATSSAISKGVPAHKEAANPIQVSDTISQLYFNTQQDIGDYLADVIDWGNSEKVRFSMDVLSYPLLSVTPPSGTVGTKIEVGSYIEGITTPTQVHIGDKNPALDDILKSISIENSDGSKVLLRGLINRNNNPVDILQVYKDSSTQVVSLQYKNSSNIWNNIYTTAQGYATGQNTSVSASGNTIAYFSLANLDNSHLNPQEVIITTIDPSFEPLNGDIFGAYSITGKPVLTAISAPENPDYYRSKPVYMLISNLADAVSAQEGDLPFYYVSTETMVGDGIMSSGWKISPDFTLALSSPEVAYKLQPCVSSIASTENNWVEVPEVYGNIYKENILGTDDVKVDDILVDTKGKFGKVKEIAEVSFKNQHAENKFAVGEEITADSALYVDPAISVDFSKFDWDNAEQVGLGPTITLMSTSSGHGLGFISKLSPFFVQASGGISVDNDIYMMVIGTDFDSFDTNRTYVIYIGIDPNDAEKIIGSYLGEVLIPEAFNKFAASGGVEKVDDLYKISLSDSAGSTIQSINGQDVWTSFISKDGRWIDDEPTIKTEIRCDVLANLPKSYNQLTDIPIIKVNSMDVSYELIPASYANKYIQDGVGFIYFCDGERFYELKGSSSNFDGNSITITAGGGLTNTQNITADNYSADIELHKESLGEYQGIINDAVYGKRGSSYGWMTLPSISNVTGSGAVTVTQNGDGREVSLKEQFNDYFTSDGCQVYTKRSSGQFGWTSMGQGSVPNDSILEGTGIKIDAPYAYSHRISLSQDVQDSLAKANSALQESALSGYATTSQVDAKYTKPAAGIPETDLSADIQSALTKANSSISGVKVNGTQVTVTDGVADIGTVITAHQSLDGKQDKLSETQLAATNSGITSAKVSTYDGYATSIQTLTTNLSSSDAKITQNTADITELKTTTVKKADMKGLELPDLPSADGNYALTCTITGGVPTFAWTIAG